MPGSPYTGSTLLGLLLEGEGVGAQVLTELGADVQGVRSAVLDLLAGRPTGRPTTPDAPEAPGGGGLPSGPRCPSCGAAYADTLAVKAMAVPAEAGAPERRLVVAYCTVCDRALGVFPE
jgi:ATP-dependent Clp protease ATP-binding subunit ClpC